MRPVSPGLIRDWDPRPRDGTYKTRVCGTELANTQVLCEILYLRFTTLLPETTRADKLSTDRCDYFRRHQTVTSNVSFYGGTPDERLLPVLYPSVTGTQDQYLENRPVGSQQGGPCYDRDHSCEMSNRTLLSRVSFLRSSRMGVRVDGYERGVEDLTKIEKAETSCFLLRV